METRRVVTSAVVVTALGALTALTVPALAGTERSGGPAPAPGGAALAPEMLTAMQEDLDLSGEQVRVRLDRETWASRTTATLRDDLGEDYAGAWLSDGAERLMVAVTGGAAAARVRAAGAEPRLVRHSGEELAAARASLDGNAGQAAEAVTGWYVDVATNAVVLVAPAAAEAAAWEFAAGSGIDTGMVRVEASDEQPRLLFDLRGGDAYFIEDSARCSIGFSVVDGNGGSGFVTAGHCALAGTNTTGFNGEAQGQFVAASFPGVGAGGPDDFGVVGVNLDWTPQPVVSDFNGGVAPVAGAQEAPVGSSVCKSGSTTGVSCGVIQATNATVNYPEGTVTGLLRTDVCAEGGDSGGALLAGDQAQGVTSGGSGNCTVGGITFFQPLTEILDRTGLTLVTTG